MSVSENDWERFSLKDMLAAVSAVGGAVPIAGQSYRVFYGDGVAGGVPNPAARLFAFMVLAPSGIPHIYLISESQVPSEGMAVFKLFGDVLVGLSRQEQFLRVYTNP